MSKSDLFIYLIYYYLDISFMWKQIQHKAVT